MTVDKLRFNLGNTNYDVPTKEYVDSAINNIGSGSSSNTNDSSQSINLNDTPVGYITWQMALMPDYLKLDGTNLANASTSYKELLDYATNNNLITNDVDNKVLFKYNDSTDILTLPNYIDLVLQGGNTVEEKEAGLPNIEGELDAGPGNSVAFRDVRGSFTLDDKYPYTFAQSTNSVNNAYYTVILDASHSSNIYGNSTTVQPPAITLIPQIKYRKDTSNNVFYNDTPIGTIISYMGPTAPKDYLICDGTIYNIDDYKELANFINTSFGSYSYFGGNGTTTFAVPDLRGEFLRGSGTNSHTNQGNGESVGTHQDGTEENAAVCGIANVLNYKGTQNDVLKVDSILHTTSTYIIGPNSTYNIGSSKTDRYISRPTNTSVLYCIKYTTSVLSTPENNYSTTEQRIGTWINGKPLYQKTFQGTMPSTTNVNSDFCNVDITNYIVISLNGFIKKANGMYIYCNDACRMSMWATDNDLTIRCRAIEQETCNCIGYVTLQYTKTTD